MKLSACIIAKNEENNISKAIESFKNEVDEIIVVDTGSTDKTVEIAESLGATVHFFEWNDSFADAKNHALSKATGDWIIFLDADEYFSKETSQNIKRVIKKYTRGKKAESLVTKRYDIDTSTGVVLSTGWSQRIFHRTLFYSGSIHEGLAKSSGETVQAQKVTEKDLVMYHTGYSRDILLTKHNRNAVLLENLLKRYEELGPDVKQIKGEIERSMVYFYLATAYTQNRDFKQAERYARLFIESGKKTLEGNSIPYRVIIASKLNTEKKPEAILKEINIAIDKFPDFPDFYDFRGLVNYQKGLFFQAKNDFEKALQLNEDFNGLDTSQLGYSINRTYKFLGKIYSHYGNAVMSKEMLIESLKINTKDAETFSFLFSALQTPDEIESALDEVDFGKTEDQIRMLANTAMSLKMNEVASHYLAKLEKLAELTDVQAARLLFANKQYNEAFVTYQKLCKSENDKTQYEALLLVSALLSGQEEHLTWLEGNLSNETIKKAFNCLRDGRILAYSQNEKETLELLISELGHADALPLYHILWLNYVSSITNSLYHFLDEMSDAGFESFIIDLIEDILKASNQDDGVLYNKLAVLYMRIGNHDKCLLNCAKALEYGYFDHVTLDVIEWLIHSEQPNTALGMTANNLLEFGLGIRSENTPDYSFFLNNRVKRLDASKVLEAFTG